MGSRYSCGKICARELSHCAGRCSDRNICPAGDSSREPWIVSHNVLNAHALAVSKFRKTVPSGKISINLNSDWAEPMTTSKADVVSSSTCFYPLTCSVLVKPLAVSMFLFINPTAADLAYSGLRREEERHKVRVESLIRETFCVSLLALSSTISLICQATTQAL